MGAGVSAALPTSMAKGASEPEGRHASTADAQAGSPIPYGVAGSAPASSAGDHATDSASTAMPRISFTTRERR